MSYAYGEVEAALQQVFKIDQTNLPAFRSKLKRFKELGIPSVEKTGTGVKADYQEDHLIEIAIATAISGVGTSPKWIPSLVGKCVSYLKASENESDLLVIIREDREASLHLVDANQKTKTFVKNLPDAALIVNLSSIARKTISALSRSGD